MSIAAYSVGSAAAETLLRLGAMDRAATQLRTADRINIAGEAVDEALGILSIDGNSARELLIAAANLIKAAEQLEPQLNGVAVPVQAAA